MTATYEMLWDCPYCGTRKLLGQTHRHCPGCGAPQGPAGAASRRDRALIQVLSHEALRTGQGPL